MKRDYRKWWSPSLGRDMEMLIFGDSGIPILALPGNNGRFFDWEDNGLIDAIEYQINEGYNSVYCLDSVDFESLLNTEVDPYVRIMRQKQYEGFLVDEVIPLIKEESTSSFIMASGIHLGAYQVMSLALRYPHKIDKAIAIDGEFDIKVFLDDFYDENVYFFNPVDFLPNLNDVDILNKVRETDIRIVCGEHSKKLETSKKISQQLWHKGVQHALDIWPDGKDDNWETWGDMLKRHVP